MMWLSCGSMWNTHKTIQQADSQGGYERWIPTTAANRRACRLVGGNCKPPMRPSPTNVSYPSPIEGPSSQPSLADSSKRLLPWLIAVSFFMESLDTTILNTGVPTIAAALHVAPLSMKSVLASYTLSLAVFIPISGWMADRFGTRRVFASAIGIFTLGSFLCGISSDIHLL